MRLIYSLIFCVIFSAKVSAFDFSISRAQAYNILDGINNYFSDYYKYVEAGKFIKPENVLFDLKEVINNNLIDSNLNSDFQGIGDLFTLTKWLNNVISKYNLGINIFIIPDSAIVNCWAGELVSDKNFSKEFYGKKYNYRLVVLDKLIIHDYFYKSEKKDEIGFVTKENLIFCNKEALDHKIEERWGFLLSRYDKRKHTYNPSKSDKLRRKFLSLAWEDLFLKIINGRSIDEAKKFFFKKAEAILLEVAVYHELGHIIADSQLLIDDEKSEEVALLTELAFGPSPYESLNTLLSFAWRGPWKTYKYAGQYLLRDFIEAIEDGYFANTPKIKYKGVRDNTLLSRQNILYYLNSQQIRKLAEDKLKVMLREEVK